MKITKTFIICFLLIVSFFFMGCDLSHKHYTDNYGVCKNCNTDITVTIEKDSSGNYMPTNFLLQKHTDTYLKFISNGESKITITVNCETSNINSIILYSKTDDYIASKYDKTNPVLIYDQPLIANETYYIKIQSTNAVNAQIILNAE